MKLYSFFFSLLFSFTLMAQELQLDSPIRYLALGDSYTIGQGVTTSARWPNQLADSLESRGYETEVLRIIATTGWRTDNLINGIRNQNLEAEQYNLVSVLIGVNNQFQNRPFSQYITEFPALIDSAIRYAGGDRSRVFIVSIPDYAYTPFGQNSSNPDEISMELDQYNAFSKHIADSLQIAYFDITPISRQWLLNPSYVANDGLHPSGIQYTEWVKLMLAYIDLQLTGISNNQMDRPLNVSIHPNPTAESVIVSIDRANHDPAFMLRIFNEMGILVKEFVLYAHTTAISIAELPDGLYLFRIDCSGKGISKQIFKKSE